MPDPHPFRPVLQLDTYYSRPFFANAKFGSDPGDLAMGGGRVGLVLEHYFYGALLEPWGVLVKK